MFRLSLCIVVVFCCLSRESFSQMKGNPELLVEIASKFRDNQNRISTWSGNATVRDETFKDGELTYFREANVTFVYSSDGDQLRFDMSFTRQKGTQLEPGDDEGNRFQYAALRRKEGYYRYGPIEEGVEGKNVAVGPTPRDSVMKGFLGEDFDPFVFSKVESSSTSVEEFSSFYFENREHIAASKSSIELTSDINIASMTTNESSDFENPYWEYRFDLSKAGLPVFVQGGLRSGTDVVSTWENEFINVDGVWLPSKHRFSLNDQGKKTVRTRVIEYSAHQVNAPVDEAVFEVASLPLRKGDKLFDLDKEEWTRVGVPASTVVRDTPANKLQTNRSFYWWLFIMNLIVVVLIAVLFLSRNRTKKIASK